MIYNKLLFSSWLGQDRESTTPTDMVTRDDLMQDSLIVAEEFRARKS
jgi:hypothetical protein